MTAGDALEVLGALAIVAGGFVWAGLVLALVLAGVALIYFGQVYQDVSITPRLPHIILRRPSQRSGALRAELSERNISR